MQQQHKIMVPAEVKVHMEKRLIEGYASVFDVRDFGGDVVQKGAYSKTIQDRLPKNRIKVMRDHEKPIGLPLELREDSHGLFAVSKISETELGDETLTLARDGVLDGMSVGIGILQQKFGPHDGKASRFIKEVMLHEYSICTFPMNDDARVTSVKAFDDAVGYLRGLPDAMRIITERGAGELTEEELRKAMEATLELDHLLFRLERVTKQFEIQTLIFPKSHWDSADDAVKWAKDHGFKSSKVDETGVSFRLRQKDPDDFQRMRTICLDPRDEEPSSDKCRVKAVGGPLKKQAEVPESVKGLSEILDLTFALPMAIEQLVRPDVLDAEARLIVVRAQEEFTNAAKVLSTLVEPDDATPEEDLEPVEATPTIEPVDAPLAAVAELIGGLKAFQAPTQKPDKEV